MAPPPSGLEGSDCPVCRADRDPLLVSEAACGCQRGTLPRHIPVILTDDELFAEVVRRRSAGEPVGAPLGSLVDRWARPARYVISKIQASYGRGSPAAVLRSIGGRRSAAPRGMRASEEEGACQKRARDDARTFTNETEADSPGSGCPRDPAAPSSRRELLRRAQAAPSRTRADAPDRRRDDA